MTVMKKTNAEPNFIRPTELQAAAPLETRGGARDGVKLLVSTPEGHHHSSFVGSPTS